MTDKEMAVNWIRSQGWDEENLPSDEFRQMFQAFLAGLKTGRPEWHKVADGDLPSKSSHVVLNQDSDHVIYHTTLKKWFWTDGCYSGLKVIAWCEIPKYTEG